MCNEFPYYGRCRSLGVSVCTSGQITNPPERARSFCIISKVFYAANGASIISLVAGGSFVGRRRTAASVACRRPTGRTHGRW